MMNLNEHGQRVAARSEAFFGARDPGHALVLTQWPVEAPAVPPLCSFDLDRELGRWLDARLANARPAWEARGDIDDDRVPCLCPSFGIAEHSAWLGLDVRLQEWTCLPLPRIADADAIPGLRGDPSARWFGYMRDGYEHLRSRQDGTFVLSVRGTMSPMDIANAVRGDEFFADVVADPDLARALVKRVTALIPWYYDQLASWADDVAGGRVFHLGGFWAPPDTLGHLSNDAAMLCGPDVYAEFGFPYEAELARRYRHVIYHVHNEKMHFIPQLAQLPNLALLEVSRDPKTVHPLDDLQRILDATGDVALMLAASSDQVRAALPELARRNVVLDVTCRDAGDAADVVRVVRAATKPLG